MLPEEGLAVVLMVVAGVSLIWSHMIEGTLANPLPIQTKNCLTSTASVSVAAQLAARQNPNVQTQMTGTHTGTFTATPVPNISATTAPYTFAVSNGVLQAQTNAGSVACVSQTSTNPEGPAPNSVLTGNP